ncbi:hypothetical protein DFH09DRAFT_1424925 [Mycena vulgaris]|nr:hypothetical protein DFH09DRAFT_1424925 [Mycena vulgaris]
MYGICTFAFTLDEVLESVEVDSDLDLRPVDIDMGNRQAADKDACACAQSDICSGVARGVVVLMAEGTQDERRSRETSSKDERSARAGYRVVVATFYFYFGGSAGTGAGARYSWHFGILVFWFLLRRYFGRGICRAGEKGVRGRRRRRRVREVQRFGDKQRVACVGRRRASKLSTLQMRARGIRRAVSECILFSEMGMGGSAGRVARTRTSARSAKFEGQVGSEISSGTNTKAARRVRRATRGYEGMKARKVECGRVRGESGSAWRLESESAGWLRETSAGRDQDQDDGRRCGENQDQSTRARLGGGLGRTGTSGGSGYVRESGGRLHGLLSCITVQGNQAEKTLSEGFKEGRRQFGCAINAYASTSLYPSASESRGPESCAYGSARRQTDGIWTRLSRKDKRKGIGIAREGGELAGVGGAGAFGFGRVSVRAIRLGMSAWDFVGDTLGFARP